MRGIGIVLTVLGIVLAAAPKAVYTVTQSWKNEDSAEPSGTYQLITRIEGIALIIAGIVFITR